MSFPGIPNVDPNLPLGLQQTLQPMKENIEIMNGTRSTNWQQSMVSLGMLVTLGVITTAQAQSVARSAK